MPHYSIEWSEEMPAAEVVFELEQRTNLKHLRFEDDGFTRRVILNTRRTRETLMQWTALKLLLWTEFKIRCSFTVDNRPIEEYAADLEEALERLQNMLRSHNLEALLKSHGLDYYKPLLA